MRSDPTEALKSLIGSMRDRLLMLHEHIGKKGDSLSCEFDVEFVALHVRKLCEAFVLASFIGEAHISTELYRKFQYVSSLKGIIADIARRNPSWLPRPWRYDGHRPFEGRTIHQITVMDDSVISISEIIAAYDAASSIIHQQNPLHQPVLSQIKFNQMGIFTNSLFRVLPFHTMQLSSDRDFLYLAVEMKTRGIVRIVSAEKLLKRSLE